MSSTAGPALSGARDRLGGLVERLGGRTGRVVQAVQCELSVAGFLVFFDIRGLRA